MGIGVIGFADALDLLKPDIMVLLGDRFEILAAAQAAMIARIPIAHLHGGEATEGLIDEAIRHAITKMSHFHFVAADPYRSRVIQMGESPEKVFNFGAPGLENISRLDLLTKSELEKALNFKLGKINFLVTFHPTTLQKHGTENSTKELLSALDNFPEAHIIFTKTNADTDGRIINKLIDTYVQKASNRMRAFTSMGQLHYLSLIKYIDAMIGNSSSGIIEAPAMKKATVDIGDRQKGRLKAPSIIECKETSKAIISGINKALSEDFQKSLGDMTVSYNMEDTSVKIKNFLKKASLTGVLLKTFHKI